MKKRILALLLAATMAFGMVACGGKDAPAADAPAADAPADEGVQTIKIGLVFPITLFGSSFEIPQQGLAILSLVFIWLYRGRKGYSAKWFQQLCYWFYPAHMLLLLLIKIIFS